MTSLSRKDLVLLVLLTLCWGVNWPIMKIGVQDFPPLTFRVLGMLGGLPAIWLVARWRNISLTISREQMKAIAVLALPNMLVWHFCMILSVSMLSSGRAAILGYTMPVWAVLAGLIFFGDRVTRLGWLGVGCALSGALLLLSSEMAALAGQPLGSLLALIAAAGWGYGTVLMKRSQLEISIIALTFWMIGLAMPVLAIAAILLEASVWRLPTPIEWGAIWFNALIVFAFAHVVWFQMARTLPPIASSLSVMMIPVVGVFAGAWLLNERPLWQDYAAMLLIVAAMSTVLLKPTPKPAPDASTSV